MPKCAKLLIIFILLALPAISISYSNPQIVKYSKVSIDESGKVSIDKGEMRELELNLSIPTFKPYQKVYAKDKMLSDQYGNSFISIKASNPPNPFLYSSQIVVEAYARSYANLSSANQALPNLRVFLSPTSRTQSSDPILREVAFSIIENATTDFEKVARLAIFVHNYINYSESLVGEEKDALWVLQNKKGVCAEYATLFVAMARAVGIPARYATGYVYSEKYESWLGHAWAEVHLGEWIPVDPTWFEVGALDALHIETSTYPELSREPSLSVRVTDPTAKLSWISSGRSGALANNIKTLESQEGELESDFQLLASSTSLPPGSEAIAYLSIQGSDYRVIPVSLATCTGQRIVEVFPKSEQYLILEPGKNATAVWKLEAGKDLDPNYVYTCPLTLNSPYLEPKVLDIKINPRASFKEQFFAAMQNAFSAPGQENSVIFSLPQSLVGKKISVIEPSGIHSKTAISTSEKISFASNAIGRLPVYAVVEDIGYKQLFYVSEPNQSMSISYYSIPSHVLLGEQLRALVRLSARSYPSSYNLSFLFAGEETHASGVLNSAQEFEIMHNPSKPGSYSAKISLRSSDGKLIDEKNELVLVFEQPEVSIKDVQISKDSYGLLTTIFFETKGAPSSPIIAINGVRYRANDTLKLRLPEGTYEAEIIWEDAAGNAYSRQAVLNVRNPGVVGIFEKVKEKSESEKLTCPLALAILLAPFAFVLFRR
ncbi:MAG: transglutaminase-like domain-containing protein [Candidatus Anstonellaceae archaeon]